MRSRFTACVLLSAVAMFSMSAISQAAEGISSGTTQFRKARVINAVTPPKPALYIPPLRPLVTSSLKPVIAPSSPAPPMADSPVSPSIMKPAAPVAATISNAPAAIINTPAPTVEPQGKISVSIKNGLLSVHMEDITLSRAMEAIGQKAKFEVKLYGDIPDNLISTEFEDTEVERAVARIMSLVGQKDYFFYYDSDGGLTLLEAYGASSIKPQPTTPVKKSMPSPPSAPRATVKRRPAPQQPDSYEPALADEPAYNDQFEEDIQDDPYQGEPAYIPPARRR